MRGILSGDVAVDGDLVLGVPGEHRFGADALVGLGVKALRLQVREREPRVLSVHLVFVAGAHAFVHGHRSGLRNTNEPFDLLELVVEAVQLEHVAGVPRLLHHGGQTRERAPLRGQKALGFLALLLLAQFLRLYPGLLGALPGVVGLLRVDRWSRSA